MELEISKNVLRDIVMAAVDDIGGIWVAPAPTPVGEVLKETEMARLPRALKLTKTDAGLTVDLGVNVEYGGHLADLAKQAQRSVADNLELMSGCKVLAVNVSVLGVVLPGQAGAPGAKRGAAS